MPFPLVNIEGMLLDFHNLRPFLLDITADIVIRDQSCKYVVVDDFTSFGCCNSRLGHGLACPSTGAHWQWYLGAAGWTGRRCYRVEVHRRLPAEAHTLKQHFVAIGQNLSGVPKFQYHPQVPRYSALFFDDATLDIVRPEILMFSSSNPSGSSTSLRR